MAFLTTAQMKTHIYQGTQNLIAQGDTTLLQTAIDTAISEAKGYLSRYNIDQLFDNVNADPAWTADPTLHFHCKNMAKWHFIGIANANTDYEDAQARYDRAVKWLQDIQSGKVVPVNWLPAEPEKYATFFHVSSNRKRGNHF